MYRRFGEVDAAGTSPLYERVAVALSESGEALRAIEAAPARKRHPRVILAALHDLASAVLEREGIAVDPSQIAVPPGSARFRAGEVINYAVYQASGVVNSITAVLSPSVR